MNELTIELTAGNGEFLYEQIYEYIRQEIIEGKILQGEKLPSTRILAEHLQVARSTVSLAYEQLLSEGYMEALPYKGYYACRIDDLYQLKEKLLVMPEQQSKETESCQFYFSPTAVDMEAFPFHTWKKISKSILSDDKKELFSLGLQQGDEELRTTIARYLHASRGVKCTREQIVIGAGNDYLLMLLRHILNTELTVAFENPTYMRAYLIFQSLFRQIKTISMDDQGINIKELEESGAQVAYVMPSHQYPTGVVMPIGRRIELLRWASEKEDRYLIEDDYDSEFRYKGKPIPSLQASDTSEKVIYIGTFSKSIAPAIRVSYMVLPQKLLELYYKNCYFMSSTVSRIDQAVINEFIQNGTFERYLNKRRKLYKEKHDYLLSELRPFLKKFLITGENAGLHILMKSKIGRAESDLIKQAYSTGVKVQGISEYLIGKEIPSKWQGTILIGYAGLSKKEIGNGIEQLKKVWL